MDRRLTYFAAALLVAPLAMAPTTRAPAQAEEPAVETAAESTDESGTTVGDAADAPAAGGTTPREAALADAIAAERVPGRYETFGEGEARFFARFEPAHEPPATGALLFVPRRGAFVGADPLVAALADELPANGWTLLAVQLPLAGATADLDAWAATDTVAGERLARALEFLAGRGERVVVAGAGHGARLASALVETSPGTVLGFAALGRWPDTEALALPRSLGLIGSRDALAQERARARARAAREDGHEPPETLLVAGAGARLEHFEAAAARRLRGWMKRVSETAALAAALRD